MDNFCWLLFIFYYQITVNYYIRKWINIQIIDGNLVGKMRYSTLYVQNLSLIFIIYYQIQTMTTDDKKIAQMKQQIAMYLRKKDYYDILGIQKGSDQAQIKKAYKKLALRFHPDKNTVEGAKAVFNKVSNAYSNLIDPEKRASYDRFGPEQDRAPQYRPQRNYRQGYSQQDEFEEIFRAFFGGMPAHRYQNNHFQHFTFNMGGPRGQNNQQNNGSNLMYLAIFIFISMIFSNFFSKDQPIYSLTPSSTYKHKLITQVFKVQYFVRQEYFKNRNNPAYVKKIQHEIEYEFILRLNKQCDAYKYQGAYYYGTTKEKYRQSCLNLNRLKEKYHAHIQDLIYGY